MLEERDYPRLWWDNTGSPSDNTNPDSRLMGNWRVNSMGWVGGWPIHLEGTNLSVIFEFKVDTFIFTVKETSTLLCETTGTYQTGDGKLYLSPTGTRGSECTDDFLVPAVAEYAISGETLTLTEIADDPVWYELWRIY